METLLHTALSNAVAAVVLAVVVILTALVCRRPALLHVLWVLVLLKLLTPPLVPVRLSWPAQQPQAQATPATVPTLVPDLGEGWEVPPLAASRPAQAAVDAKPQAAPVVDPPPVVITAPSAGEPVVVETPSRLPSSWDWQSLVVIVWLSGSVSWFALASVRLWRFRRLLRHSQPAPAALQERARRLSTEMGLRQAPTVWLIPGRLAPMLWAIGGKPRLLLPDELLQRLPDEQQATLLIHELAHLKRSDHLVRLLEFLACGLYWWHPVVWYACRELREAEEQCCDAWVVSTLPESGRTYATALVETLDFLSEARPTVPVLASALGPVSDLKRRLTMILRGTTPRSLTWHGCLAVLILSGLCLPLLPTWGQDAPPQKPSDDLDKVRVEVQKLQADLQQRRMELQQAEQQIAHRLAMLQKADANRELVRALEVLQGAKPTAREIVLREVNGRWVIVSSPEPVGGLVRPPMGGQPMVETKPLYVPPPPNYPVPQPGLVPAVQPIKPFPATIPAHGENERRLDHLEKKLEQLEKLIRELKKPEK